MAIEKKLMCFKTQAKFDEQLQAGNILDYSIVFIKDTQKIWTHGTYFTSLSEILDKIDTKQDLLSAGDNVNIEETEQGLVISAKDTTYTLELSEGYLVLKDSDGSTISSIDFSNISYSLPQATSDTFGGIKLVTTIGKEGIATDDVSMQVIPSNGRAGQILSHDGTKAVWIDFGGMEQTTYGVRWDTTSSDPHLERVGNISMHKSLPIQSGMRGCVYNPSTKEVAYWLDSKNWNFRENPVIISNVDLSYNNSQINTSKTTDLAVGQYVRIYGTDTIGTITYIEQGSYFNVSWIDAWPYGTVSIEIGSRLDGYDGEVMVYVPEFWIKSWDNSDSKEVRISQVEVDDTWTYQPALFVGAYKDTILNRVPENMGYLSTLEVNAAVCVANTNDYCRGGNNNGNNDSNSDIFKRNLGKCRTTLSRNEFRSYVRKSKKEIMSYSQYKNIIYWLWVIEYGTFDVQDTFTGELTSDKFKQGGMGAGVTNVTNWSSFNSNMPIVPNGYTNDLGNSTNIKLITSDSLQPSSSVYAVRWRGIENPFGDTFTGLDGLLIDARTSTHSDGMIHVYTTTDSSKYGDTDDALSNMTYIGNLSESSGYIKEWGLGDTAEIIPNEVGGSTSQYKCDFMWSSSGDKLKLVMIGSGASYGGEGGLCAFYGGLDVDHVDGTIGYRSVVSIE